MNRALVYSFLIMLFSPVVGLYSGLKSSFSTTFKRRLLILFITIYGSVITISDGHDGYVHSQNVYTHYIDLPFTEFLSELGGILLFQSNTEINDDVYIHVLSYTLGSIVGLPGLFFIVVSFVYAYFFSGSVFRVLQLSKGVKYSKVFYGFVIIFLLWKNIEGINTVRTWTGLWILFYACISYYQTKNKKYLYLMFVPPFIHVAYFVMAIPAWLVLFFGVRRKIYIALFCLSFVTTLFNQQAVVSQLERTEVGAMKTKAYYQEEQSTVEGVLESTQANTWYKRFYEVGGQNWGINCIALSFILFGVYKNMNYQESSLFSIGLLTKTLSNSTWFLFALSNRSGIIAGVFILASLILLWQRGYFNQLHLVQNRFLKFSLYIALLLCLPFVIYRLADLIYFLSIHIFFLPFIPWFDPDANYSVREFINIIK